MNIDKPYNFRLKGKAKDVFKAVELLATTEDIEADLNWWRVRAIVIANDRDLATRELTPVARLLMRIN